MSPKEAASTEYYRQKQCSVLGIGIYHLIDGKIECNRVDIFSDCLNQDGETVVRAFRFLRTLEWYKKLETKQITTFTDCGKKSNY